MKIRTVSGIEWKQSEVDPRMLHVLSLGRPGCFYVTIPVEDVIEFARKYLKSVESDVPLPPVTKRTEAIDGPK